MWKLPSASRMRSIAAPIRSPVSVPPLQGSAEHPPIPRAHALGSAVSPFQHQARLRRSQREGNLADDVPQRYFVIMVILLNIRGMCQFKFLRSPCRGCAAVH
jgi:hypothetical protein